MTVRERGKERKRLRQVLEAKRIELLAGLQRRDGIEIEAAADTTDTQQKAVELELKIVNLERDSMLLRLVENALQRMEKGTYGVCTACEEEISLRRLMALPWTPCCLKCQEEVDRGNSSIVPEVEEVA
ncbi:MAG TPA: TraR/DksA family transcriptional regulator [Bryobacteraceae bacterium]|nr:TraR/DksA family transcriptional regulator [Bryobacteraceae bacterium]